MTRSRLQDQATGLLASCLGYGTMGTVDESRPSPITFRNILFAMDFSAGSLRAFPFAMGIARRYEGKLFVAHITPPEDLGTTLGSAELALDRLLQAATEAGLKDAAGGLAQIPHELLFEHGEISSRLLATADSCKIDLIVIGTHGWRGIKKLLKGSTAEEIACLSTRPVLIVGPRGLRANRFQAHSVCNRSAATCNTCVALCCFNGAGIWR